METDKRPILATNHLLLICQCHYVGDLRMNSAPRNLKNMILVVVFICLDELGGRPR